MKHDEVFMTWYLGKANLKHFSDGSEPIQYFQEAINCITERISCSVENERHLAA